MPTAKATTAAAPKQGTGTRRAHNAVRAPQAAPVIPEVPAAAPDAPKAATAPRKRKAPAAPEVKAPQAAADVNAAFKPSEDAQLYGEAVLDEVSDFLHRFIILPSETDYALMTLWAAHTYAIPVLDRSGRLAFLGDEPGIGKTRALDLLSLLCNRGGIELDPTGPAFVVKIATEPGTILLDETDTTWGKSGGSSNAMKTLRAILNSGYRRGATVTRKAGKETVKYSVFGPVAFAGMGTLPDTLMSRSIVIRMRKRKPHEKISTYMPRMHEPQGRALGAALGDWVMTVLPELRDAWPDYPDGIEDRNAEVAESILAVADAAGGHWPGTAREAIVESLLSKKDESGPTPAEMLMRHIREVWPQDEMRIFSHVLVERLFTIPGAPWREMWAPIAASREIVALVNVWEPDVGPVKVNIGGRTLQGYKREEFARAFARLDALDRERQEAARKLAEMKAQAKQDKRGNGNGSGSSGDSGDSAASESD